MFGLGLIIGALLMYIFMWWQAEGAEEYYDKKLDDMNKGGCA